MKSSTPAARIALATINLYRNYISDNMLHACRFTPSCSLYAEEAIFNSGVLGALKGKAEIEKAVAEQMKKTPTITVTPKEAHMRGDVLWGIGDFAFTNGPSGHYGFTMVKDPTGWRIVLHVSNVTPPK